jgi:ABC-type antimicrobial peptide transport system permease subunit
VLHDWPALSRPFDHHRFSSHLLTADGRVLTMNQIINRLSLDANFEATLLAAFAGISLLLAAVGLFGVLAYLATQRRTEMGIRLALGAQREHVLHLMLLDGLAPAFGGAAAGSLLAIAAAQLIRSSLFATKPLDPAVFAGVIGPLLGVATTACLRGILV